MKPCGKMWYNPTRHRWQYNMKHVHFMLDNWGYKHTFRIINTYCFSEATMVKRKRLNVTFVHTLSVFSLFTYIFCDLSKELNLSCFDPVFVFVQVLPWERRYNKNCTTEAILSIWVMMEKKAVRRILQIRIWHKGKGIHIRACKFLGAFA